MDRAVLDPSEHNPIAVIKFCPYIDRVTPTPDVSRDELAGTSTDWTLDPTAPYSIANDFVSMHPPKSGKVSTT